MNVATLTGVLVLDRSEWEPSIARAMAEAERKYSAGGDAAGERFAEGAAAGADAAAAGFGSAGDQAGRRFADGATSGVDGAASGFGAAGSDAGRRFGDAAADSAGDAGEGGLRGWLSGLGDKLSGVTGLAGTAIGATLLAGIDQAFGRESDTARLQAQLGLSDEDAASAGRVAGKVWSSAWGESVGDVGEAVGGVLSTLGDLSSLGEEGVERLTTKAHILADTFDLEVSRAISSAGVLISSGLAKDADEAFDLIARGLQKMPAHLREDLLEASDEYGQFFAQLGYTGEQAFAILTRAASDGTYGIDKMGDAVKEFTLLASDVNNPAIRTTLQGIGLDADEMAEKLLAGGDQAAEATGKIVRGLLDIEDPGQRASASVALFGTPLEDLSKDGIPEFLSGLVDVGEGLGDVSGTVDQMGDALDTNASKMESYKRRGQAAFTDLFVGGVDGASRLIEMVQRNIDVVGALGVAWLVLKGRVITTAVISAVSAGFDRMAIAAYNAAGGLTAAGAASAAMTLGPALVIGAIAFALMRVQREASNAKAETARLEAQIDALAEAGATGAADLDRAFREDLAASLAGTGEGLEGVGSALNDALDKTGTTVDQLLAVIRRGNGEVTGEMVMMASDLERAAEGSSEEFYTLQAAWRGSEEQAAVLARRQEELGVATDDSADAAAGATGSTDDLTDAQSASATAAAEQEQAYQDAEEALRSLTDTVLEAFDGETAYARAMMETASALDELELARQARAENPDDPEAAERHHEAAEALLDNIRDQADAFVSMREAQAAANGETLNATERNHLYIEELYRLADTLDPDSTLRTRIAELIAELQEAGQPRVAEVQADIDQQSVVTAEGHLGHLARDRFARLYIDVVQRFMDESGGYSSPDAADHRWGGVDEYARGGVSPAMALGPGRSLVKWREPETGGEAYIPRLGDRARSLGVLRTAARWLDVDLVDRRMGAPSVPSLGSVASALDADMSGVHGGLRAAAATAGVGGLSADEIGLAVARHVDHNRLAVALAKHGGWTVNAYEIGPKLVRSIDEAQGRRAAAY